MRHLIWINNILDSHSLFSQAIEIRIKKGRSYYEQVIFLSS